MVDDFVQKASAFQSPSDLAVLLEEHRASITKHDLFTKPANKVLDNVWMAVMLGFGFRLRRSGPGSAPSGSIS